MDDAGCKQRGQQNCHMDPYVPVAQDDNPLANRLLPNSHISYLWE